MLKCPLARGVFKSATCCGGGPRTAGAATMEAGQQPEAKEGFQAGRSKTIGRRELTNPAPAVAFSVKLTMPPLRPP